MSYATVALNPTLYASLCEAVRAGLRGGGFGGREVRVANAGAGAGEGARRYDPVTGTWRAGRPRGGEEYLVCCPFCGDTRYRLSVNHRFGVTDPAGGGRNLGLIHCYNEGCEEKVHNFQDRILDRLSGYRRRAAVGGVAVAAGGAQQAADIRLPPGMMRLDALPDGHVAREFIRRRRYDPDVVGREFGLGWVAAGERTAAAGRVVIPVMMGGGLAGWQARYVGDGDGDVRGVYCCRECWHQWRDEGDARDAAGRRLARWCPACGNGEGSEVQRYLSARGFRKGAALLGYDVARTWPFGVICEGPMDVLRVGHPGRGAGYAGPAVSLFGHSLSAEQQDLVVRAWGGGAVVLLLDGDAAASQVAMAVRLRPFIARGVVTVALRGDPDEMEHGEVWAAIVGAADAQGVTLAQ